MNSELDKKPCLSNLRYYPGICMQGLKKPNEKYQPNLESRLELGTNQTQGMFGLFTEMEWLQVCAA